MLLPTATGIAALLALVAASTIADIPTLLSGVTCSGGTNDNGKEDRVGDILSVVLLSPKPT